MKAKERREHILGLLKESKEPISATQLAKVLEVSRQVIVGDVALLRAQSTDIIATHRGYILLSQFERSNAYQQKIVCQHDMSRVEEELRIVVRHGGTLLDVEIEHPIYGTLKAPLAISNETEMKQFLTQLERDKGQLLCELTSGIHTHTLSCQNKDQFNEITRALKEAGILIES